MRQQKTGQICQFDQFIHLTTIGFWGHGSNQQLLTELGRQICLVSVPLPATLGLYPTLQFNRLLFGFWNSCSHEIVATLLGGTDYLGAEK